MADKDLSNIQIYRKKRHINIGVILFGMIFVYLVFTILAYATQKKVSVYEVREGSIQKDTAYTGLVLRDEEVVSAESSGYVNYFATEGSKVGCKSNVYSISGDKLDLESGGTASGESSGTASELTAEEQATVIQKIGSFAESFRPEQYSDVYTFKNSLTDVFQSKSTENRQARLDALLESGSSGLTAYAAQDDGIVVYSVDGYESLTKDNVTADLIAKKDYSSRTLENNTQVSAGDPVYKLVTGDEWTIAIELDDDTAKEMADLTSVKVRFSKDGETTWTSFALYSTKDSNLGFLTLDHSMVRYVSERFLDIELILEDQSGLKIPRSSVVKRDFYTVPQDYLTKGGDSSETGVLVQGKSDTVKFTAATVYYRDPETDLVYLDTGAFDAGTVLQKPDSGDTCTLADTASLKGVYNVNNGYAEFCQVDILCSGDDYYIVSGGSDYSLSNYDHIALDGSDVHENDIVF